MDTLDEDYELELSEPALSTEIREIYRKHRPPGHRPPDIHLLEQIPYNDVPLTDVELPERVFDADYERAVLPEELYVRGKY